MGAFTFANLFLLLNFGTFLTSLACPECPYFPPRHPTKPPPYTPKPPKVHPPHIPKPPVVPVTPPYVPPVVPVTPPYVPKPPVVPPTTPCPPPPYVPKPPSKQPTCPIDTLKLEACIDLLGGVVHVVVGKTKATCCPVLGNLSGLDAAICLCTTIKAKLLDVKVLLPIALELLINCGKTPPKGFQCPA